MEAIHSASVTGLKTMQLNDQKAGMEGLDKEMINKIIFEASKGTAYFAFQEKRQKSIDSKVSELHLLMEKITEAQRKYSLEKMTALGICLEKERDLSHSIVHIDMDAFFAAVEMQDNPELKEKPMAVGSLSMLSTSNYHARKYGVRAAMPGFIAKKLCPDLIIVSCNFQKYREVSGKIRSIVKEYDPDYCSSSLDEVYLDLTDFIRKKHKKLLHNEYCLKNDLSDSFSDDDGIRNEASAFETCLNCCQPFSNEKQDNMAYDIVKEIREKIYASTQLTASAGIAPNTMLAKVCSDVNKPNGQYQISSSVDAVKSFISTLPVKKVSGIGPVQGQILNAVGIYYCTDMWEKRDLVANLFSPISVDFYLRVALGIGSTTVKSEYIRKSIGVEQTFKEISCRDDLLKKCQELCNEMIDDMKKHNMLGKVVVLKLKNTDFQTHTRNHSLTYHTDDKDIIHNAAKKLLDAEISAVAPQPLKLRLMGIRMDKLVHEDSVPSSEKQPLKLTDFLKAKVSNINKSPLKCYEHLSDFNQLDECQVIPDTIGDNFCELVDFQSCNEQFSSNYEPSVSHLPEIIDCKSSAYANSINTSTDAEIPQNFDQFSCPVCGLYQNVENLVVLNKHIDNCLNRVAIKEILAEDTLEQRKRKLSNCDKKKNSKLKLQRRERRIDDYFH